MILFKRFIIWGAFISVTVTQILLYIPIFTCKSNSKNSLCSAIYKVNILESSTLTNDFVKTMNEILRLLSYLTLDMGWDGEIKNPRIYDNGYLKMLLESSSLFKVNYFGYCKYSNGKRNYCTKSYSGCLDLFGILVKDMGIYLSQFSSNYENNQTLIGSSIQYFYYLTLSTLYKFLKKDQNNGNKFLQILYGYNVSDIHHHNPQYSDKYKSAVILLYISMISNKVLSQLVLIEFAFMIILLLAISGFGLLLFIWKKQTKFPLIIMILSIISFTISSFSFVSTLVTIMFLKKLEVQDKDMIQGWEMLQVTLASGFVFTCIRHGFHWIILILGIITKRYYSKKKPIQPIISNDEKDTDDK